MINYWICVTNEENWKIVSVRKVWGVPERDKRRIAEVKPGDILVFYVMPKKVCGIFKVISDPFENREKLFSWGSLVERNFSLIVSSWKR
jgi:predicted RNA-binding protein